MEVIAAKSGDRDLKQDREAVLRHFVQLAWRATRGLSSATEDEGRNLIRAMVETGRVTREQGDRLLGTLLARMGESRDKFEERVDGSVGRASMRLREASNRELERLSKQTLVLEERLLQVAQRKKFRS